MSHTELQPSLQLCTMLNRPSFRNNFPPFDYYKASTVRFLATGNTTSNRVLTTTTVGMTVYSASAPSVIGLSTFETTAKSGEMTITGTELIVLYFLGNAGFRSSGRFRRSNRFGSPSDFRLRYGSCYRCILN